MVVTIARVKLEFAGRSLEGVFFSSYLTKSNNFIRTEIPAIKWSRLNSMTSFFFKKKTAVFTAKDEETLRLKK